MFSFCEYSNLYFQYSDGYIRKHVSENDRQYSPPDVVVENNQQDHYHHEDDTDNDNDYDQDMVKDAFCEYELEKENYLLKATAWKEGHSKSPQVGGVNLGKIPILRLDTPSGCPEVDVNYSFENARDNMKFHSCQGYIPTLKKLSQKTGLNRVRQIGSLPAMVTNLLLPSEIYSTSKEEKKSIIALIRELDDMSRNMKEEIDLAEGNNCIRLEFYFSSSFQNADKDWCFPSSIL